MLLRAVSAESRSQNFAEGYLSMGTHFMEGGYLQAARPTYEKDNPWPEAFAGSLVSDVTGFAF